jgi:four helix bundle protein
LPRLNPEFVARIELWADRSLAVNATLAKTKCPRWIIDQFGHAATSVGANLFEADQAVSRPDFCRCLGVSVKELSECRFWIRLIGRQGWIPPARLTDLESECVLLQKILNSMIVKTRKA